MPSSLARILWTGAFACLLAGCLGERVSNPSHPAPSVATQTGGQPDTDPFTGTCDDKFPEGIAIRCMSTIDPVCGCDGKTYRNSCVAMGAGHVYVKSPGACPGQPFVED